MKVFENQRAEDWLIRQAVRKMGERDRTGLLHASEIYQCYRRTWFDRHEVVEYSRDAVMRFAVGFSMQEWFLGPEADGEEVYGIILSTDRLIKNNVIEFKTTRKPYEKLPKDENGKSIRGAEKVKFDVTEMGSWIDRTRAYCAAHNVNKGQVFTFFIYGDLLKCFTLEFTDEELEETRQEIDTLRTAVEGYLAEDTPPPVTTRRYDYECGYCPFLERCKADLIKEGMDA